MRKSGILGATAAAILAFVAAPALAANVDHVSVSTQDGNPVISLSGAPNSVAAEIYSTLDKAGASDTHVIPGRLLTGKLIRASVAYLNGAVYDATLTVDASSYYGLLPNRCAPAKSCANSTTRLIIGGDVATELYVDMEKAGDPEAHGVNGSSVVGKALTCSFLLAGEARYTCSISLGSAH